MNYFKSLLLTAFALLALAACDTDDLRDDVDNLKGRVESLEAQVTLLNDNMTAIKRLLEGGQTITELSNTNGTYTLKLSNGETITLTQGAQGEVKYPEITVNDEGQWVVNGEVLKQNGTPVQAVGTPGNDGATPKFRLTEEGSFWQVSYDGVIWEDVLDVNGNRVSAVSNGSSSGGSGADSFFEEVGIDATGEFFVIKLKGQAEAISIPIVKELLCEIVEPETGMKNGCWEIGYGKTATTTVKVKGENVITTAPAGWMVTVSEVDKTTNTATLSITAPSKTATANTRATADNNSDVTVQVNKGANWAVDKIQVKAVEMIDSYYELYNNGGIVEINGVKIQKETYGEATLITSQSESKEITKEGVYFIQPDAEITYSSTASIKSLILIGDNSTQKSTCVLSKPIAINGLDNTKELIVMNMNIDGSNLENYISSVVGTLSNVIFTNNEIFVNEGRNLINCTLSPDKDNVTKQIMLAKNIIKIKAATNWKATRIVSFTVKPTCESVIFDNNIVYAASTIETNATNGCIFFAANQDMPNIITISNNTFINFISNSQPLVIGKLIGNISYSNLLFYYNYAGTDDKAHPATLINVSGGDGTYSFEKIIRYDKKDGDTYKTTLRPFAGTVPSGQSNSFFANESKNPFDGGTFDLANGIFIPSAEYAEYGASLN